jgi:hypothetical protein
MHVQSQAVAASTMTPQNKPAKGTTGVEKVLFNFFFLVFGEFFFNWSVEK